MKKEVVTMLLAGGVGKRLRLLTQNIAKPAVPFGGRYRIIDFALSNCLHSRMDTVGLLTQYSPLALHKHVGNGQAWDLDRQEGGLSILAPFTELTGGDWYRGTADAITKNMNFVDQYDPEYLLVISGDHIYHMDYSELLEHHKETGADATLSVVEVPWKETHRFGILNTTEDLRIYEFDEKPEHAKSNLASMGIYMFNWKTLKKYLEEDKNDETSDHDFGHSILPRMVEDKLDLFAYRFQGYWKDVGTIESYWEANMDLLQEDLSLSLSNKKWRTYSHDSNYPPQFVEDSSKVTNSMVNSGCWIKGTIDHSVLFEGVQVEENSVVKNSILHPNVKVGKNVHLDRVIVIENVEIPDNTEIITKEEEEPVIVHKGNVKEYAEV